MGNPLEPHGPDPRIEDFLDHVCQPLVGLVPFERRQDLRREIRMHIWALVEDEESRGLPATDAIEAALRELGEPYEVGRDFLEEWNQGVTQPANVRSDRPSAQLAFGWLGSFTAADLLLLDAHIRLTPFGSFLSQLGLFLALSPLLAGILIGLSTPDHLQRSVGRAILICVAASSGFAVIAWPSAEGLAFAVCQLVLWGPTVLFVAQPVSTAVRRLRNLRFWRQVRGGTPVTALLP